MLFLISLISAIDFIGVLLATVVYMLLGMFWYSSAGFGKQFMSYMGLTKKKLQEDSAKMPITYGLAALGGFLQSTVISLLFFVFGIVNVWDPLILCLLFWLGFSLTTSLNVELFNSRAANYKLLLLNSGYRLITILAAGYIFYLLA